MLTAIDVRIYPQENSTLPHPCAHMLHAALLDMVRSEDPALSQLLHDDAQMKPFSVSTLWPRCRVKGDVLQIPKYTECRFRLCTASRVVFEAFAKPLYQSVASNGVLTLGPHRFTMLQADMEGSLGAVTTYKELLKDMGSSAMLKFSSPMSFKRKGMNVPLPDPQLVYNSLWQKWQAFSDLRVEESVYLEMMEVLALSAMDGHTRAWKFPRNMVIGFVGLAEFELVKRVSVDAMKLFGALNQLAFYTGVGSKTTMGLGQCRMLTQQEPDDAIDALTEYEPNELNQVE